MPRKKTKVAEKTPERVEVSKLPITPKLLGILAGTFFVIWILIGLFLILIIFQSQKRGILNGLFSKESTPTESQTVPAETDITGVGRVNIECVKSALSQESIQKLLQAGNIDVLVGEEKTKFEACIIAKETPIPSPAPSGSN